MTRRACLLVLLPLALAGCRSGAPSAAAQAPPEATSPGVAATAAPAAAGSLPATACNVSTQAVVAVMGPVRDVTDKKAGPTEICTWLPTKDGTVRTFIVTIGPVALYDNLAPTADDHPEGVPGFDKGQFWATPPGALGLNSFYLLTVKGDKAVFLDGAAKSAATKEALAAIAQAAYG